MKMDFHINNIDHDFAILGKPRTVCSIKKLFISHLVVFVQRSSSSSSSRRMHYVMVNDHLNNNRMHEGACLDVDET